MKTLRNIIDEAFDQKMATALEPVVKKYADRAAQDKSPDTQILQQLMQEIQAVKTAKPVTNTQPPQIQPSQIQPAPTQGQ